MAGEIKTELERIGYFVLVANGIPSVESLQTRGSLLILDRLLHGVDSLPTLVAWRRQGIKIPVLLISVLSSVEQVAEGLRSGADDYLTKPFQMTELVARVGALLRRLGEIATTRLAFDDLELDLIDRVAFRRGKVLSLLPRELKLLEYFLRHSDQVITRKMLLKDVWQQRSDAVETNVIDSHISNLRRKIDDRGKRSRIANLRGVGFILRKVD